MNTNQSTVEGTAGGSHEVADTMLTALCAISLRARGNSYGMGKDVARMADAAIDRARAAILKATAP